MPSKHKPGWYSSPISCADVGLFTVREGIVAEGVRGDLKGRSFDERIGCAFGSATGGEGSGARRRCCGFVLRLNCLNVFRMREGAALILLFVEPGFFAFRNRPRVHLQATRFRNLVARRPSLPSA